MKWVERLILCKKRELKGTQILVCGSSVQDDLRQGLYNAPGLALVCVCGSLRLYLLVRLQQGLFQERAELQIGAHTQHPVVGVVLLQPAVVLQLLQQVLRVGC